MYHGFRVWDKDKDIKEPFALRKAKAGYPQTLFLANERLHFGV